MNQLASLALRIVMCSATLTATVTAAAQEGPFGPGFGPTAPDFGPSFPTPDFGGVDCQPIGDLPDFCIPDFGPSIPTPFEDLEAVEPISLRYQIIDAASDFAEPLDLPYLAVYAVDTATGRVTEARRGGWIVLPKAGTYVFHAESPGCSIASKRARVTEASRILRLNAFCE